MFSSRKRRLNVFRLIQDREGDDDGVNVSAQQEVMVGLAAAGVVGVEVDIGVECLCGFERARVDGFEGEAAAGFHRRLMRGQRLDKIGIGGGNKRDARPARRCRCR